MSADLIRQKARERHFLEQLLDGRKLENYKIPVPIKAELRKYQQVCVTVLKFQCTLQNLLKQQMRGDQPVLLHNSLNISEFCP